MTHYFKSIAQLKRKELSNRSIAVSLNLARNTVKKAVKLMEASELTYIEIESLDEGKLHEVFDISTGPKRL